MLHHIINYFKKLIADYEEWMDPTPEKETKVFNCHDLLMVGREYPDAKGRPSFTLIYPTVKMVICAKDNSPENAIKLTKLRASFIESIGSHSIVTMKPTMNCYMNYEYKTN